MRTPASTALPGAEVLEELRRLEAALARAQALAARRALGAALPGAHLLLDARGARALVPAALVAEVVRVVAIDPLVGAVPPVLGTFVHRGRATVAIDLARALGAGDVTGLDARLVVLATSRPVALLADGAALVAPPILEAPAEGDGLVAALCRSGDLVAPLLRADALVALAARAGGEAP